jgi:hypothetical protein
VFVENKPGHLADALATLATGGINLRSFTIADTNDYGILRLVVDQVERAKQTLAQAGYVVVEHAVVRALLPDKPGALAAVVRLISESGLDIEYVYQGNHDTLLVRTEELERMEELLVESGFRVLGPGTWPDAGGDAPVVTFDQFLSTSSAGSRAAAFTR